VIGAGVVEAPWSAPHVVQNGKLAARSEPHFVHFIVASFLVQNESKKHALQSEEISGEELTPVESAAKLPLPLGCGLERLQGDCSPP
jgi:hypothetical protein